MKMLAGRRSKLEVVLTCFQWLVKAFLNQSTGILTPSYTEAERFTMTTTLYPLYTDKTGGGNAYPGKPQLLNIPPSNPP